jgi:signal transduction histidine kinase
MSGDTYALTVRLNNLSGLAHWTCIHAEVRGQTFFERGEGRTCEAGLFERVIEVQSPQDESLKIRFALALDPAIQALAGGFLLVQFMLLSLAAWTSRQVELARLEGQLAIGKLIGQVAHDIRSPLAALKVGLASMGEGNDPEARELVGLAATRIQGIAADLLQMRKGSEARVAATTSVEGVIVDVVREKRLLYPESVITFPESMQAANHFFVRAPREPLRRVIANLLQNAIESQKPGSKGARICLSLSSNIRGQVSIAIQDDGIGIADEVVKKLGRSETTLGKRDGNGIGLSYAYELTRSWGGTLTIEKPSEGGTMVSVSLPLCRSERAEA